MIPAKAPTPQRCAVSGYPAGHPDACNDCDPCLYYRYQWGQSEPHDARKDCPWKCQLDDPACLCARNAGQPPQHPQEDRMSDVITAKRFKAATGVDPEQDDLERCNCTEAGNLLHQFCGWDNERNKPNFWPKIPQETTATIPATSPEPDREGLPSTTASVAPCGRRVRH